MSNKYLDWLITIAVLAAGTLLCHIVVTGIINPYLFIGSVIVGMGLLTHDWMALPIALLACCFFFSLMYFCG